MYPSPTTAPTTILCLACETASEALVYQWLGDSAYFRVEFVENLDGCRPGNRPIPDVILLDSRAGSGSLATLSSQWPTAGVVVLLEPTQAEDAMTWLTEGADDYLIKTQVTQVRLTHTVQQLALRAQTIAQRVEACTAELRQAKETAEAANRLKDRLIADLGHDLRPPPQQYFAPQPTAG